jgi:hypothetical protein
MGVESTIFRIHRKKIGRLSLHFLFWLFFYGALLYAGSISLGQSSDIRTQAWLTGGNIFTAAIAYYLLVYGVWKRLLAKRKWLGGALSFVLLILLYAVADYARECLFLMPCKSCMEQLRVKEPVYYHYLQSNGLQILLSRIASMGIVFQLFNFMAIPVGIKLGWEYVRQRIDTLRLQNENIQLEFNFLKSQVNPHFLFNTLNNIHTLIQQDKKTQSAETVTRLANFMRYTLYDSDGHSNAIGKEITLLKDYIALEQIRLNNTIVNFTFDIDKGSYRLPPLLFFPVVENAFKFCGRASGDDSWIFMNLEIIDGQLRFSLSNTYEATPSAAPLGGIGLMNLRRRLEHYYPGGRHKVESSQESSIYKMNIRINLANHDQLYYTG